MKRFNLTRILLYYGKVLLAAAAFLGPLSILAILAELDKERISLNNIARLFAVPGIYPRLTRDMLPGMLAVSAAIFLASSFIASLYELNNWRKGAGHIWRCIFGQSSFSPFVIVADGKIDKGDDVLMPVGGPGSILIHNDSAVVLERGGRLTRVLGPGQFGFGSLRPFEKVHDVIDVRPMRWEYAVIALSKEGILVTVYAEVNFQIDTGGREPTAETPYPALDEASFKASTSRWMRDPKGSEDDQYFDWARRVIISETEGALRGIVARYPLDALVGLMSTPAPNTGHPRKAIQEELSEALRKSTLKLGVQINKVRLGKIEVDDEVTNQWIEVWRNRWQNWAMIQEETGKAVREQLWERAKDQAQVDMITAVTRAFQQSVSKGTRIPSQLLIMRLIEVFDRSAADLSTRVYLPRETLNTLKYLRSLISEESA